MRKLYYFKATLVRSNSPDVSWYVSAKTFTEEQARDRLMRAIEGHKEYPCRCELVPCTASQHKKGRNYDGKYVEPRDTNWLF